MWDYMLTLLLILPCPSPPHPVTSPLFFSFFMFKGRGPYDTVGYQVIGSVQEGHGKMTRNMNIRHPATTLIIK